MGVVAKVLNKHAIKTKEYVCYKGELSLFTPILKGSITLYAIIIIVQSD